MKASELKYFSNFREGLNKDHKKKLGNSNFRHFTHSPHESWMEKILWNLPIFPLPPNKWKKFFAFLNVLDQLEAKKLLRPPLPPYKLEFSNFFFLQIFSETFP